MKTWMIIYFNAVCCHPLYVTISQIMQCECRTVSCSRQKKRVESVLSRGRDERFPRARFETEWNTGQIRFIHSFMQIKLNKLPSLYKELRNVLTFYNENTKLGCWDLRPLHTESEIFACVFPFFRIHHPFLSKCMQRMRKRRKSNLIQIFFDGRKFRTQCTETFSIDYIALSECTVCMRIKFDIIYWVSSFVYPSVYRDVR